MLFYACSKLLTRARFSFCWYTVDSWGPGWQVTSSLSICFYVLFEVPILDAHFRMHLWLSILNSVRT